MENVTDVTAGTQTEAKLRSREAQFISLVDTALDGFVIAHPDGQIQWINHAMVRLLGTTGWRS